jgi:hypothetical protein
MAQAVKVPLFPRSRSPLPAIEDGFYYDSPAPRRSRPRPRASRSGCASSRCGPALVRTRVSRDEAVRFFEERGEELARSRSSRDRRAHGLAPRAGTPSTLPGPQPPTGQIQNFRCRRPEPTGGATRRTRCPAHLRAAWLQGRADQQPWGPRRPRSATIESSGASWTLRVPRYPHLVPRPTPAAWSPSER